MKIQFIGGTRTVTGSCFLLQTNDSKMLVDCGMFQGHDAFKINSEPFVFNPADIDILILTHAHMDHSGLIPKLVKDGFKGKIIATPATLDLLEPLLKDSAHIQQSDTEWLNKKAFRQGKPPVLPLYTLDDVNAVFPLFKSVPYENFEHIGSGVKYRLLDAGHILGSASVEVWFQDGPKEKKIVFSGDIGKKNNPIIKDPSSFTESDYVLIESTYGNRLHRGMKETIDELVEAIKTTFTKKGNVLIPAFAVGRTQDLLYILNKLVREGRIPSANVYIDSPLAEEITKKYLAHPECFDEEAKKLMSNNSIGNSIKLHFTNSVEDSMALNKIKSQAIIIAGSGMCDGGRIRHHFKYNLWRPECSVIFTGFQAKGTLGRRIVDQEKTVHILGEEIAVKAKIYTLGGFSAHADQKELLEWLAALKNKPEVFVVHGEEETSLKFAELIKKRFNYKTHVPEKGEVFEL